VSYTNIMIADLTLSDGPISTTPSSLSATAIVCPQ
jgi:hypothetical protein